MSEKDKYKYCPTCTTELVDRKIDNLLVKTCNNCGFIFWNNPIPTASILIHKDNKVLMLQRSREPFTDYWVLPGGFVEHTETPQEAITRETKEETGLDIEIEKIVGIYRYEEPRGVMINFVFQGKFEGEVILSEEHGKWQFFPPTDLPEHIAYKHREAINDWRNNAR